MVAHRAEVCCGCPIPGAPLTVNQILLVQLPADQPTSYITGGRTRYPGTGSATIPHPSQVLTVGRLGGDRWRLAPAACRDWVALQEAWVAVGGEPVRLTEAVRPSAVQAVLRAGWDAWVEADKPTPGGPHWNARTMRTAFAARAGESFHGCGMSVDIDVGALFCAGLIRGSNAVLAKFWALASEHGWTPIIPEPDASRSEAWHFDHTGGLLPVRRLFEANHYLPAYDDVARVANALAGTLPVDNTEAAYVQARLTIGGFWCGKIDGLIGAKTLAALKAAGVELPATRPTVANMVAALNHLAIGDDQIGAL